MSEPFENSDVEPMAHRFPPSSDVEPSGVEPVADRFPPSSDVEPMAHRFPPSSGVEPMAHRFPPSSGVQPVADRFPKTDERTFLNQPSPDLEPNRSATGSTPNLGPQQNRSATGSTSSPGLEPNRSATGSTSSPGLEPNRSATGSTPGAAHHSPPLRRLDHIWIKNPVYFLTVCVAHRARLLSSPTVHEILRAEWQTADARHGWQIGRYVVMPDHVHFFACPLPTAKPLSAFLHAWKQWTAKGILAAVGQPAPLWQPRTFDHVLRQRDSYAEKCTYVEQNPVRAGLVQLPSAWPYAGHIHFGLPL